MVPASRSSTSTFLIARIFWTHAVLLGLRAPAAPFLLPAPLRWPYERWAIRARALPRLTPFFWRALMAPSVMSPRRSSREIAFSISEIRVGSNQTRLTPHFSTDATMRFWLATSLILLHPFLRLGFGRCLLCRR